MNLTKHHLLAAMLLAVFCTPAAVSAEITTMAAVVSPPTDASEAVDAAPADRMELRLKVEPPKLPMDPAKSKAMLEKQAKDRDALQKMGPAGGMGMMLRPGMDLDGCHDSMGPRHDRTCHDELSEQRLDTLETQMDMMQMMLRMMLGH